MHVRAWLCLPQILRSPQSLFPRKWHSALPSVTSGRVGPDGVGHSCRLPRFHTQHTLILKRPHPNRAVGFLVTASLTESNGPHIVDSKYILLGQNTFFGKPKKPCQVTYGANISGMLQAQQLITQLEINTTGTALPSGTPAQLHTRTGGL